MADINWTAIKAEYIAGEGSYRTLAKKYGIRMATLAARAKAESWVLEREKVRNETVAKAIRKNETAQVNALSWLGKAKERLAEKLAAAVEAVDETDAQAVRQIVAAVKDAQIVLNDKTDAQIREQEARIRSLERQAEKDDKTEQVVTVTFAGEAEEWAG